MVQIGETRKSVLYFRPQRYWSNRVQCSLSEHHMLQLQNVVLFMSRHSPCSQTRYQLKVSQFTFTVTSFLPLQFQNRLEYTFNAVSSHLHIEKTYACKRGILYTLVSDSQLFIIYTCIKKLLQLLYTLLNIYATVTLLCMLTIIIFILLNSVLFFQRIKTNFKLYYINLLKHTLQFKVFYSTL